MRDKLTIFRSYLATRYLRNWNNRDALESWQEKRIARHIEAVRKESPFYRELWDGKRSVEWRSFPIIDKGIMMEHFDSLNTVGMKKEEAMRLALEAERSRDFSPAMNGVTVGLSSGTSGNRGLFLVSDWERYTWAGAMLAKVLPGSIMSSEKVAFFLRADSRLYSSVRGRRLQFRFYDLLQPLERHIDQLNVYKPSIVVGPPSLLRLLAGAAQWGALAIAPAKVISVAEVLDPLDRSYIEAAFGGILHQVYQCTEGFLASTCRFGTLHINEDIVAIQKEYVDADKKKFMPIVTDFTRVSQPIIRYRLNDLITEGDCCSCGSPLVTIASIDGRSDDLFYLPGSDGRSDIPVFPDYIARAVIVSSDRVSEYKVIQHDRSQLEVMLELQGHASWEEESAAVVSGLDELFLKLGCVSPVYECTRYQAPEKGVKLRRVENKWKRGTTR
ncbi:adenylate cyclase [Paenibacillus sp. J5C_2022]|uniref:F390 synthetase-related protein n=1 Tax=Paenibacillus sp. J5C2022 TaxID=2977129 RepID=UPI0021D0BFE9|nr:F390 synthetase-related protein [Paenibacillus sp. J5C2022]MCU6709901.1 adenylate cyclase [Paenibacillus sp. J5C2022]